MGEREAPQDNISQYQGRRRVTELERDMHRVRAIWDQWEDLRGRLKPWVIAGDQGGYHLSPLATPFISADGWGTPQLPNGQQGHGDGSCNIRDITPHWHDEGSIRYGKWFFFDYATQSHTLRRPGFMCHHQDQNRRVWDKAADDRQGSWNTRGEGEKAREWLNGVEG